MRAMICVYGCVFACFVAAVLSGCGNQEAGARTALDSPLSVQHIEPQGGPLEDPPYPHMWYYRTEVRNASDRELRIIWFEAYVEHDGVWYPGNAFGRVLRSSEFSAWYGEGDSIIGGVIPPGGAAVCDVNWYGSETFDQVRTKWAFVAVDQFGFDYFVEAEVPAVVQRYVHRPVALAKEGSTVQEPLVPIARAYDEKLIKEGDDKNKVESIIGEPERVRSFEEGVEQWDYHADAIGTRKGEFLSGLAVVFRDDEVIGVMPRYMVVR